MKSEKIWIWILLFLHSIFLGCGGWTISGTVWDSEAFETLSDVKVRLISSNNETILVTETDEKGDFQIKGLKPKEKYKLQLVGERVETKEAEYDLSKLSKDKVKNCLIKMELLCVIEGDVLDENSSPIYDAPVQLLVESKSQKNIGLTDRELVFQSIEYTNTSGKFMFFGLRPQRYKLRVDKPGYKIFDYPSDNTPPFELKKGQVWSTKVRLEPIPETPIPELKPPKRDNSSAQGGEVITGE